MRRTILLVLGLTLACGGGGVAAGHQLTSTDGDDVIKGSPTTIAASRSGRTITLVVPKSKLPKAKTTRLLAHTQFLDTESCATGCWDLKATNRQQHSG